MKIVVAIKQVPARDSQLRIDAVGQVDRRGRSRLRDQRAGCLRARRGAAAEGEARRRSGRAVRRSGARRANHPRSAGQGRRPRDPHRRGEPRRATIRWRSRGCWPRRSKPRTPDLILTGLQSDDLGYGQTGVILAELLGLPHATIIMQVEKQDGGIRVKRELEDGWFQHVEMPLPALLTIQSGINKLRYATLMGIKKAKTKEIKAPHRGRSGRAPEARRDHARARLPAGTHQADADLRRQSQGSGGQAGGETEIRGEGHMSILAVSGTARRRSGTACRSRRWPRRSRSARRTGHAGMRGRRWGRESKRWPPN